MGTQTTEQYNREILIGQADKYGKAWHYNEAAQGDESNHYDQFIPVEDVRRRLFHWTADKAPLYRMELTEQGVGPVEIEGRFGLFRSDTGDCLNVVTGTYEEHQYDEALLQTVATILDVSDGELGIASAGLLDDGGTAWVQVEMTEGVTVGDDKLFPFLTAATSHNSQYATSYRAGAHRVVCDNTLAYAMNTQRGSTDIVKVKHTKNSGVAIDEARRILGVTFQMRDDFAAEVEALLAVPVTTERFAQLDEIVFPKPMDLHGNLKDGKALTRWGDRHDQRVGMFLTDPRVAPWTGTGWGFVQTINTWAQHVAPRRGDRAERNQHKFLRGEFAELDRKSTAAVLATV